jgi:hypothetical protein
MTISNILNKLTEVFAPMDAQVLEDTQAWAKGRVKAISEFKKSDEYKTICSSSRYEKLFALAGGKTWYNVFDGRNASMIEECVIKHCAAVAAKRNKSIEAKLIKAGVFEVISETFVHTNDGFNGIFVVMTDSGKKVVTIDTILAGGYNIQCLHLRVLVKVK